jgi:hypothetical protein
VIILLLKLLRFFFQRLPTNLNKCPFPLFFNSLNLPNLNFQVTSLLLRARCRVRAQPRSPVGGSSVSLWRAPSFRIANVATVNAISPALLRNSVNCLGRLLIRKKKLQSSAPVHLRAPERSKIFNSSNNQNVAFPAD